MIFDMTLSYLHIVFMGIVPVFIYNFFLRRLPAAWAIRGLRFCLLRLCRHQYRAGSVVRSRPLEWAWMARHGQR